MANHPRSVITVEQWGGSVWKTIHFFALGYDARIHEINKESADSARSFFIQCLPHLLPCETCRSDFGILMSRMDIRNELETALQNGTLFAWTVLIHDMVNQKIKQSPTLIRTNLSEAKRKLLESTTTNNNNKMMTFLSDALGMPVGAAFVGWGGAVIGAIFVWGVWRVYKRYK